MVVTHEYVHYALRKLTDDSCPFWLSEGLAVYLSQELPSRFREMLCRAVEEGKYFELELLERGGKILKQGEDVRVLVVAECESVVRYLIERLGKENFARWVGKISFFGAERALEEFGLNYYLLEKTWLRWVKSKDYKGT